MRELAPPPEDIRRRLAGLAEVRDLSELRAALRVPLSGLERALSDEAGLREEFFERVLPDLAARAAAFDRSLPSLPVGRAGIVEVERGAVAAVLAQMFLCAIQQPRQGFERLLAAEAPQEVAKVRCIVEYFSRLVGEPPRGRLRIERLVLDPVPTLDDWFDFDAPLTEVTVHAAGTIEDAGGCLQVDFANRFIGGGVLSGGCVQEEIRFAICPELIASMPLCPPMDDNEALRMRGAERYCDYDGYGFSLRYGGPHSDAAERDSDGAPVTEIAAIDATPFRGHADVRAQLQERVLVRELNKAFVGFRSTHGDVRPVATGNWGCGVFGGHHQVKAVVQWAAAAANGRAVRYYTFGDPRVGDLTGFVRRVRDRTTVGGLVAAARLARGGDVYAEIEALLASHG